MVKINRNSIATTEKWKNKNYREKIVMAMRKRWKNKRFKKKMKKAIKLARVDGRNKGTTGKHWKLSEKTKQIHSLLLKGHIESEKTRKKIGLKSKGRKHSEEAKRKMSLARKGVGFEKHRNAVLEEMKKYRKQGFKVLNIDKIHPDFIARMGNKDKFYAVEVELSKSLASNVCIHKYDGIDIFNDIHWIKREKVR